MFHSDYQPSTWIPYLIVVLDFLKGMAWPLAALFIAALFSREIKQMIPRIRQVGPSGLHIESADQEGANPKELSKDGLSTVSVGELTDPVALAIENENRTFLEDIASEDQTARLLRALTVQQLYKSFAIAYSYIFGSQIRALRELNVRSISRPQAEHMLKELKADEPVLREWELDQYLNFLVAWDFIVEEDGWFKITVTGKNFLLFLTEHSLPDDRPN